MEIIISKSVLPGTVKMAKIVRVNELCAAEDYVESEKQIYEILAHVKEYESENDLQFRHYLKAIEESPSDIEPELRDTLVIEACYQNHFKKALTLAEGLKEKFPAWDPQSVNGAISMLKRGWTPYPYFR